MRCLVFIQLALIAIGPNEVTGQRLSPGYVVTIQNDTLRGFIQEGTDTELGLSIQYKRDLGATNTTYTPSDLLGFTFDYGRGFKTFSKGNRAGRPMDNRVFAKKNLEGKISLFTHGHVEKNEPDIFLVNHATPDTVHLTQPEKKIVTRESGSKWVSESTQFIGWMNMIKGELSGSGTRIRYNEKSIRKDILKYNESYKSEFPLTIYQPKRTFLHEISVGIPVQSSIEGVGIRVAFFRGKYFPERSENWSFIHGISYRHLLLDPELGGSSQRRTEDYHHRVLSLIPVGMKYEGSGKFIKPYAFLGVGIAAMVNTYVVVVENEDKGRERNIWITPTLNIGAGLKIKIGPKFVFLEVSPSAEVGLHANLGFSF